MLTDSLDALSTTQNAAMANVASDLGVTLGILSFGLVLLSIWSLVWKGLALWKASQKKNKIWFIVMLVANTLGILEILYLFIFSKMGNKQPIKSKKKKL